MRSSLVAVEPSVRCQVPRTFCERCVCTLAADGWRSPADPAKSLPKLDRVNRTLTCPWSPISPSTRPKYDWLRFSLGNENTCPGRNVGAETAVDGSRSYSYEPKKWTLSWTIGPPSA